MNRFWLVLLSMVLIAGFSTHAFAVDVKFSGSFYAVGMYLDKTNLMKDSGSDGISTAFYYQRLRVQTDFVVAPGLTLITRVDAMERAWGAPRAGVTATPTVWPSSGAADTGSAGTVAENENIVFDWAYINYLSPIGTFRVGYMNAGAWGTVFMDTSTPVGKMAWSHVAGPWFFTLQVEKWNENSFTAKNSATTTDLDKDKYSAAIRYTWKCGDAGLLGGIGRDATNRVSGYKGLTYILQPYAKAQIGPVKVQAELNYFWGKVREYEIIGTDQTVSALSGWVDAVADLGMFYAGGTFAYVSGDDPSTDDKLEGYAPAINGGRDWDPCLIMWNNDRTYWAGSLGGYSLTTINGPMSNAWFGQVRGGMRPLAPLDIMASISYATADKKPLGVINSTYGYELDVIGTYKITNNLSYMMGVGYWFVGDYFKGSTTNSVKDDYMFIHKLTLTF